jgi:hypothetical protein
MRGFITVATARSLGGGYGKVLQGSRIPMAGRAAGSAGP